MEFVFKTTAFRAQCCHRTTSGAFTVLFFYWNRQNARNFGNRSDSLLSIRAENSFCVI